MKKTKIPRKKVRGKNMKRLFACLLSLSMIPANGVAVFAAQEQAKTASIQSTEVKTQSEDTTQAQVTFAKESLVSKIGYFKNYNKNEIKNVCIEYKSNGALEMYSEYGVDDKGDYHPIGYSIRPEEVGSVTIVAHITTKSGEELSTPATEFKVEPADDDVVPFTDIALFNDVKDSLNFGSDVTHITKEQMKNVKKISGYLSRNLDGIEYAENCEEVVFKNVGYWFSDISKFAQLTKLKKVDVSNSAVRNISALQGLKNLTYVNLNNTQVSTEDRFSLFKTDDVSIEAGTEVTDLLNPKGLVQTADTITSSDSSIVSVQQEKGSDGKSEWVFKAAEGAEGKEAVLTIQNGTQKKEIKVKVTAKGNTVPDFKERSVETNIGCFKKIALKNVDETNATITSSDSAILNVLQQKQYYGSGQQYHITYRFEPKSEGSVTLIGYFEREDGTKYKATMNVTVNKEKSEIVPIKKYEVLRPLVNYDESEYELTWDELNNKKELYLSAGYIENEDMDWVSKAKNCKR